MSLAQKLSIAVMAPVLMGASLSAPFATVAQAGGDFSAEAIRRTVPKSFRPGLPRTVLTKGLIKARCKLTKPDKEMGLWGGNANHLKDRGGRSCHNIRGLAMDVFEKHLICEDKTLKGAKAKMRHLRKNLPSIRSAFIMLCGPDGEGLCLKKHTYSMHFGPPEMTGCTYDPRKMDYGHIFDRLVPVPKKWKKRLGF